MQETDVEDTEDSKDSKESKKPKDPYSAITNALHSPGSWSSLIKAYKACNYIEHSILDNDGTQRNDFGLFNCLNGTIDLNTMKFREHRYSDFITKVSGANYIEDAVCEEWLVFIYEVMCGDKELARYLQKACGYSLTTDTRLECMFFLYGSKTRNGKSTFTDAVSNVVGITAKAYSRRL
jgi:phage/plasmid-associated DNA primase